jgi:hypothetical protein
MAYQPIGAEGTVSSWTGTFNANLLSKFRPMSAAVAVTADSFETTGLGVAAQTALSGLGSVTATLQGYAFATPQIGNSGLVTFTNSTNVYIDGYTINLQAGVIETTAFSASPPVLWKTFRPNISNFSGTMSVRIDDTNDPVLQTAANGAGIAATFTYGSGATIAGNIIITGSSPTITVGGITTANLSFVGNGQLTPAGANSIFGTTAFGIPEWSQGGSLQPLVIALKTGTNTLTIADAFWNSLALTVQVGQRTMLNVGVQGSGAVTLT